MYGRNGYDELSLVLYLVAFLFVLLSYIPYVGTVFSLLALALMLWSLFRTLSKNLPKRRRELERYYKIKNAPRRRHQLRKNKKRDKKTHCYFKCRKCRSVLRIPRGKGDIIVTCPRCGERIEKKT